MKMVTSPLKCCRIFLQQRISSLYRYPSLNVLPLSAYRRRPARCSSGHRVLAGKGVARPVWTYQARGTWVRSTRRTVVRNLNSACLRELSLLAIDRYRATSPCCTHGVLPTASRTTQVPRMRNDSTFTLSLAYP
ncbi:hypothetical protein BDV93DRAFT_123407 [Ceratobasidium sp. AG-I]|nr:hypothetical protein BDV93DRAFT_123407 [Ceratobasidium sp. AG-I]